MSAARQIVAVVGMNTRAIHSRLAASLVIVVGMAAVVALTLSIFSMSVGAMQMARRMSAPDRMAMSGKEGPLLRDALPIIADTPGIKKGPDGKPLVYGNVPGPVYFTRRKSNSVDFFVNFQGVGSNIHSVRPEIKIIEGRMFTPGLREIIAGRGAVERFEGITLGAKLVFQDGPWTVVGIFDAAGGTADYVLQTDAETMASAMRRNAFNAVFARLEEGTVEAQEAFKAAIKSNPSLSLEVETEEENRTRLMAGPSQFYANIAYGVGAIMGLGAIFAALNTMYAAVSARVMEIATLRAIGFGAAPVVISVLLEAIVLALLGGVIGALAAWAFFDGRDQNYQQIAIHQVVSPAMMATGIGISLLVAVVGALFPAIRAAQLPVATALQVR